MMHSSSVRLIFYILASFSFKFEALASAIKINILISIRYIGNFFFNVVVLKSS
jgi:hypothetical protein